MGTKVSSQSIASEKQPEWCKVHCAECEQVIAYFPDGTLDEDVELELYCKVCADSLDKEDH